VSDRLSEAEIARRSAIQESLFDTRPTFSHDRPVTRQEALAYVKHFYRSIWSEEEMVAHARKLWLSNYVYAVNINGWTKPPDWTGGPVLREACPVPGVTFTTDNSAKHYDAATLLRRLHLGRESHRGK